MDGNPSGSSVHHIPWYDKSDYKEIDSTFWQHELQSYFTQGVDTRKSEDS